MLDKQAKDQFRQQMSLAAMKGKESKPLNQSQATSKGYYDQATFANNVINDIEESGYTGGAGFMENFAPLERWKSDERKNYEAARDTWVNAVLRDESGGAITDPEFIRAAGRQYFPVSGDSKETIEFKKKLREQKLKALYTKAGGFDR